MRCLLTNFKIILYFLKIDLLCLFEALGLHKKVIAFVESPLFWEQVSISLFKNIFSFTMILPLIAIELDVQTLP